MGDEKYRLTEEGAQEAVTILERTGFLPEATEDEDINTLQLMAACTKYIDASRAKGDKRTELECQDALIVAYFEAFLKALVRRIVN
jgi:hypothetical protein